MWCIESNATRHVNAKVCRCNEAKHSYKAKQTQPSSSAQVEAYFCMRNISFAMTLMLRHSRKDAEQQSGMQHLTKHSMSLRPADN